MDAEGDGTMKIEGTRFGTVDVDDQAVIQLPSGLIGFAAETRFALLRFGTTRLAYLQSLSTPNLALSVVDAAVFGEAYPEPRPAALASDAGLGDGSDVAVLVPVAMRFGDDRLFANLLAPIVVDAGSRRAAQVVLDPERYSTSVPLPAAEPAPSA
jgi:flagellar assembly factor FliW